MPDGSSIRTKVSQYYVNKRLKELESKNPQINVKDSRFLRTIPQVPKGGANDPERGVEAPPVAAPPVDDLPVAPPSDAPPPGSAPSDAPSPGSAPSDAPPPVSAPSDAPPSDAPLLVSAPSGAPPPVTAPSDALPPAAAPSDTPPPVDAPSVAAPEPPLPPIFFPSPDKDTSWKRLLELDRARRTSTDRKLPTPPPWSRIAIIGAGVAGLRTAMLLQEIGIPYKIFEASDRPGGRIFTYQFASKLPDNPKGHHDYYDVGAMRYPDNDANKSTFELFEELNLSSKMIKFVFSNPNNFYDYNYIKRTAVDVSAAGDHFEDGSFVPNKYLRMEYTDLSKKKLFGVKACTAAAFDPFRKALLDDFDKGWAKLMAYDGHSTRTYLTQVEKYPLSVVHWMETRNSGTGGLDVAFAEAILGSLEFDDPTKDVKWYTLEGGSKIFIDAMLDKLTTKPLLNHRVTSVKEVYRSIAECIPFLSFLGLLSAFPFPFPFMEVKVAGKDPEYFTHVVSTTTFANLRSIDTEHVPMTYKQRQAIRTLHYAPAIKVAIKFKTRWWENERLNQRGGSSFTDRQTRVVVYPSYGIGEDGPGVLMVPYSWYQDASRYGSLVRTSDWSQQQLDPDRERPPSEKILLEQIYKDLAVLHDVTVEYLVGETLDYHAFYWYQCPFTMGSFANFAPGQYSTFFPEIVEPAGYGRFHFAGELASHHHAWVSGALDSAVRVVNEILAWDYPSHTFKFHEKHGRSEIFSDETKEAQQFNAGLYGQEINDAGL